MIERQAPIDRPTDQPPLVIVGMPRSGTTWTKQVLECEYSLHSLMEPDSEGHRVSAIWGKRLAGRFPALAPGDQDAAYHRLWSWILNGAHESPRLRLAAQVQRVVRPPEMNRFLEGRLSPTISLTAAMGSRPRPRRNPVLDDHRLLVKTVHAPLSIEWLASEFDIDVVLILRHPGSILASWISLDYIDQYVPFQTMPGVRRLAEEWGLEQPPSDHLSQTIWRIGILMTALEQAAAKHPEWVVRTHEQLCRSPSKEFRGLYDELGLQWNDAAEACLVENDRPGKGFRTRRLAAELPDNWKQRLTAHQIAEMQRVLSSFPLKTWSTDDLSVAPED
jgi:hypothetical protein